MSLTTIAASKDVEQAYTPLVLAEFTFADGAVLRLASQDLSSASGFQYAGHDYLCRIVDQSIGQLAAVTETGIDLPPTVSLQLADADRYLLLNYHLASGRGFKDVDLTLRLILWQHGTTTFSSDSAVKFTGKCEAPEFDGKILTVRANSLINVGKTSFPIVGRQARCPWTFPVTATDRQAAADDDTSPFYRCGYSPDASGSNARGNGAYTTCDYTFQACVARLGNTAATGHPMPIEADQSGRLTGNFGGFQWVPPNSWRGKAYLDGAKGEGFNFSDTSQQYIPMIYGTCWVDTLVNQALGDPNSTRGEAIICLGEVQGIQIVTCNDTMLDSAGDISTGTTYSVGDALLRWDPLNSGSRHGRVNYDAIFDGQGDPSGSICRIEWVALKALTSSGSAPSIRALVRGPKLRKFHTITSAVAASGTVTVTFGEINADVAENAVSGITYPITISGCSLSALNGTHNVASILGTYGPPGVAVFPLAIADGTGTGGVFSCRGYTESAAWQVFDLLQWCGWQTDAIDVASFVAAAGKCTPLISFTDLSGTSSTHARFSSSFALRQRKPARDVINGLLRSFRGMLGFDPATGLLQLWQRGTLAEQQPAAVSGSNYNTAISSHLYGGTAANGYSAYDFSEANIIEGSFKLLGASTMAMPNLITSPLIDQDRQYVENTFSRVDSEAVARAGRPIQQNVDVIGLQNWDTANRISATMLAESLRGNAWNDTRGTLRWEFQTTQKVAHLRLGHLCRLTWQADGLSSQQVRVERIQISKDFRRATIAVSWHNDNWYLDSYGQQADQRYIASGHNRLSRPSFPWLPNKAFPGSGDSMFPTTDATFALSSEYELRADGSQIAKPVIVGKLPVNTFSTIRPPLTRVQGTTSPTGGSIPGGTVYYLAVVGVDSAGKYSMPSSPLTVIAVPGGTTNTITIPVVDWDGFNAGWVCFASDNPNRLTRQASGSGKPSSVTLAGPLNVAEEGIPDVEFDTFLVQVKRSLRGGVWGAGISSVGSGTITISSAAWTANEWTGYDCSVVGSWDGTAVPVANFRVVSNTADTLTVTPSPASVGVSSNHILVMRSKPTVAGKTLTDSKWINALGDAAGLPVNGYAGSILRLISGAGAGYAYKIASNSATAITVAGDWIVTPDSTTRYIIEEPTWQLEKTIGPLDNGDPTAETTIAIDAENYQDQTVLVQVLTMDGGGNLCSEKDSPIRELVIVGKAGTGGGVLDGWEPDPIVSNHVAIDYSAGKNHKVILNQSGQVTVNNPTGTFVDGDWLNIYVYQDGTGSRPVPAFGNQFDSQAGYQQIYRAALTYSIWFFTRHDGLWRMDDFKTGLS